MASNFVWTERNAIKKHFDLLQLDQIFSDAKKIFQIIKAEGSKKIGQLNSNNTPRVHMNGASQKFPIQWIFLTWKSFHILKFLFT